MFSYSGRPTFRTDWCQVIPGITSQVTKKKTVIFCLYLLTFFLTNTSLIAQTEQSTATSSSVISIEPTFQEINLEESDDKKEGLIDLYNQTDRVQNFSIYATMINQVDGQGNVTLSDKPLNLDIQSELNFIQIETPEITIEPNQKETVSFTVQNRTDLGPGGHYVAIVALGESEIQNEASNQTVLPALSSYVLIRKKGGERYHLSLKQVSGLSALLWTALPKNYSLVFENQGNIHNSPRGQVLVRDMFNRVVLESTINDGSALIIPQTQRQIEGSLQQIRPSWPVMLYRTKIFGRSTPGDVTFEQQSISIYLDRVFLGLSVAVIIGVMLTMYGLLRVAKHRRHKKK